jgi:hypothetical protein
MRPIPLPAPTIAIRWLSPAPISASPLPAAAAAGPAASCIMLRFLPNDDDDA